MPFVSGTTQMYMMAAGVTLADGRFFTAEESNGGRPVCAIGANVAETLFPMRILWARSCGLPAIPIR